MNTLKKTLAFFTLVLISPLLLAQDGLNLDAYRFYLESNQNMNYDDLTREYALNENYFTGEGGISIDGFDYLDSLIIKYELTTDELSLLEKNHFVVTERLSYPSFGQAYADIFHKDMPVMVTTDAILNAIHFSYDLLLQNAEYHWLYYNLQEILQGLYKTAPEIHQKYEENSELADALFDVDLYVSIAYSLVKDTLALPHLETEEKYEEIMAAIEAEDYTYLPLFTYEPRRIDFSQFKIRGHYNENDRLRNYFKAMMWLGRIDFMMTETNETGAEDIKRMSLGAFLLNELIDLAEVREKLYKNDSLITLFVGADDNVTPYEFDSLAHVLSINDANQLLDSESFNEFQNRLKKTNSCGQRIMSSIIIVNPRTATPDSLPVSFRLMGQKFTVDSYVLSQVVYDRIIYQNNKILRMMPDPLDALFALGNDDALHFLENEIEEYHYGSQLSTMRYLIDAYGEEYWNQSLYNIWLNSIRKLNPSQDTTGYPVFMKTAAWRQEKMNTQLASWIQLRHDNLLYAKQSYTGGYICSFPYSYVEPYPELYRSVAQFSSNFRQVLDELMPDKRLYSVEWYFKRLEEIMNILVSISEKQLQGIPVSDQEAKFLEEMLIRDPVSCFGPPYSGWFVDLMYDDSKVLEQDYLIADLHTQPTDEFGNMVGRVLHGAVGEVNLGIFLAPSNKSDEKIAYVGPVFSYYEKITDNFKRLNDEDWQTMVADGDVPELPEWTNVYMADVDGNIKDNDAITLPYKQGVFSNIPEDFYTDNFKLKCFPNPVDDQLRIEFYLDKPAAVSINLFDFSGRKITCLSEINGIAGTNTKFVTLKGFTNGIYFLQVSSGGKAQLQRIVLQ